MKQKIAIKFLNGIVVPENRSDAIPGYSMAFVSNMMALGFMPDEKLSDALSQLSRDDISTLHNEVIPVLKELVGSHVVHKLFYPNFPEQVMLMDEAELMSNALRHYQSFGKDMPKFKVNKRPVAFENVNFRTLTLVEESDLDKVFSQILSSADSISEFSKQTIKWFIEERQTYEIPESIPFKENLCLVAGIFLENNKWDSRLIKDTNDVLRVATYLSCGDISLSENTKFKSLPRKVRKLLIRDLERVAKEEDFVTHKKKWVRLFHNLHVGEYSHRLYKIAKKLRENEKIETFNFKVEAAFAVNDIQTAIELLKTRPGIFARRIIDLIYKDVHDHNGIVDAFAEVVDNVPVRNLTQLWGAVKQRDHVIDKRVIFPKGVVQKAYVLRNQVARLAPEVREHLLDVITSSLTERFKNLDYLGNVYIDPALYECPLPTGMRSASEGLKEVARGTRLPIGNKKVLRFFIYWKGFDIDLSASFHDDDFSLKNQITFYDLKKSFGCHSGDITNAPNGASEFIDIDIQKALDDGNRYLAMNVMVYYGPTFAEHDECFVGWMTRNKVNSNEVFEPKTVEQKIDLRSATKNVIPVIFDLKERKAIWTDISTNGKRFNTVKSWGTSGNTVESNKATIQDMIEAFVSLDNKITLGELFELHAKARGKIVDKQEDADFIFGINEGNITPYNVTEINAEYL